MEDKERAVQRFRHTERLSPFRAAITAGTGNKRSPGAL